MLIQLTVRNFAIIDELVVDFSSGMSVITGETGAGKSIAIDALGLCLGERAEASMVRQGENRADICAQFSLIDAPLALSWLQDNHLEEQQECFLRRVITADGRSKAFINGTAVPLTQLRYLGELLIQVHGQHAHQRLLKPEVQRHLLDAYGHYPELLTEMKNDFQLWQQAKQTLQSHQQMRDALKSRQDLLSYQLKELREFAPQAGEFEQIDEEYKRLSNSEQLLSLSEQAVYLLSDRDKDNALSILNQVKKLLDKLVGVDNRLAESYSLIESASIQVAELADELRVYSQSIELNPEHVKFLEERLSKQISLARKHHVSPETLADHWQLLEAEYKQLDDYDDKTHKLTEIVAEKYQQALKAAKKLHQRREHYAKELSNKITSSMSELAMPHGLCEITLSFHDDKLSEEGADKVELLVTTNPGQSLAALSKVVSGGELSRISLSVQVITAQKMALPALIFDEVDVGISGGTATTVGHLLRQLSAVTQVICVTHLPQVAGCGHHHYFVDKATDGKQTVTSMQELDKQQRINELARLLGGSSITKNTLANAKELLVSN